MVRLRNPNSLELALSYVLEEENFVHYQRQNYNNYNNFKSENSNSNFLRNQNTQSKPNAFQNSSVPNTNSRYDNYKSPFPSQPINIQPNQTIHLEGTFLINKYLVNHKMHFNLPEILYINPLNRCLHHHKI
ncbi:hypothetical protein RI129_002874 [Pyrocoelia pectoralis]|uniref:Uncharacterized protein n=1 Tax=Pyrocoelia pectoralis TaxID=417401 RepID=A0AAN7VH97_9COLE